MKGKCFAAMEKSNNEWNLTLKQEYGQQFDYL